MKTLLILFRCYVTDSYEEPVTFSSSSIIVKYNILQSELFLHVETDLITASKDRSVGVLRLGAPNHGWTEYSELT